MISMDLLRGFESRIAAIQKRRPTNLIKMKLPQGYDDVIAMFIKEENEILFNDKVFDQANEADIMAALFHEIRHAYQWHQINNKQSSKENKELLEIWEEEFHNNIQPNEENTEYYYNRNIEIDAIAYADTNINNIYLTNLQIPESIKTKVLARQAEIKDNDDIIKL
ncbi:MAG: hypothetical protein K9L64_00070 [Candidatus Izimaplasma sp.]|nr:hypothetical protein [Candidatus Izimaplasma bacterium]